VINKYIGLAYIGDIFKRIFPFIIAGKMPYWKKREAEFIVKAPSIVINEAIGLLKTLIS